MVWRPNQCARGRYRRGFQAAKEPASLRARAAATIPRGPFRRKRDRLDPGSKAGRACAGGAASPGPCRTKNPEASTRCIVRVFRAFAPEPHVESRLAFRATSHKPLAADSRELGEGAGRPHGRCRVDRATFAGAGPGRTAGIDRRRYAYRPVTVILTFLNSPVSSNEPMPTLPGPRLTSVAWSAGTAWPSTVTWTTPVLASCVSCT